MSAMNPAEKIATYVGIVLVPPASVIMLMSADPWSLKFIGLLAMLCLAVSSWQKIKRDTA